MKTYESFRTALGREIQWGFDRREDPGRLELHPHHGVMENGYYDKQRGCIFFGYYNSADQKTTGRNLPGGTVFTCLSHDIVSHEMTHALLDGLRSFFDKPTNRDVLALHEGLSDLVAVFQRFTYRDLVEFAIGDARGSLASASLLTDVARQFGHTVGRGSALRSTIDTRRMAQGDQLRPTNMTSEIAPAITYTTGHDDEPHILGSVLLSAVFDAFNRIFERKAHKFIRLATGGSGVLPPGELPADLLKVLAKLACETAAEFLTICIRAIDYCPPVDVTFGDYLRALITADADLVVDDPWGYRDAFIDAFRLRKIFPTDVSTLSEESLVWKRPRRQIPESDALSFAELRFRGDPANSMSETQQVACAKVLGDLVTDVRYADLFGLYVPGMLSCESNDCLGINPPSIESLRTSRRIGPDGQIRFDLVAEVVQMRSITMDSGQKMPFYGGATIIIGPDGQLRYSITKNIFSVIRRQTQKTYVDGYGSRLWSSPTSKSIDVKGKFLA